MRNLVELSVLQLYFAGFHAGGRLRYSQSVSASFILTVWRSYGVLNLVKILRGLRLALNIVSRGVLRRVKVLFLNLSKSNLFRVSNYNVGEPLATEKWVNGALTNIKKIWRHFYKLNIRKFHWEYSSRLMFYTRMRRLPGAVLAPNYLESKGVLNEATKLFIPTVSLIDVNSIPDRTMYGVFTNDQSWVVNFFYSRTLFVQAVLAKVKLVALFGRAKRIFLQRRRTYFFRKRRYNHY